MVSGSGTVKAIPDTAIANLGVVTENTVLEAARRDNAAKTAAVINLLNSMGIEKNQISTSAFTIDPIYDYVEGKQVFRGYRVSNILTVIINDIARAGEVIDRATFAGANRVDGISFRLTNRSYYYNKALKLAVEDSLRKAAEISNALQLKLDKVPYKVTEKTIGTSAYDIAAAKLSASVTPVLPGQLEITSVITAIFGYM